MCVTGSWLPIDAFRERRVGVTGAVATVDGVRVGIRPALFPRLFAGGENELWLGETGFLPAAFYVVAGAAFYAYMRWRGPSWRALTQRVLHRPAVVSGVYGVLNRSFVALAVGW
jgi:hypothetical protein